MTLSIPHRVLVVALTLWVALFMGGSEWIVRCPAHVSAAGSTAEAASADSAHDAHDSAHAAHAAHGVDGAPAPEHGGEGEAHRCACPGPGCSAPALAVIAAGANPLSRLVATHTAAAFSTLERLESAPDHLLPYATAPPVAALAPAA